MKLINFQEGTVEVLHNHFKGRNIFVGDGIEEGSTKPYIYLGDVSMVYDDSKTDDMTESTINIMVFTNNTGKGECLRLCDEVAEIALGAKFKNVEIIDSIVTAIRVQETSPTEITGQVTFRVRSQVYET